LFLNSYPKIYLLDKDEIILPSTQHPDECVFYDFTIKFSTLKTDELLYVKEHLTKRSSVMSFFLEEDFHDLHIAKSFMSSVCAVSNINLNVKLVGSTFQETFDEKWSVIRKLQEMNWILITKQECVY
jgi:hypothetical protein